MKNKLVSIVLISYCNIKGIYETLDSILLQNYDPIEIVISDDGTPNFSVEIERIQTYIEEHQHGNIVNVTINALPLNGGTVKNLNSGLSLVNGEYVKLISAEDLFSSENTIRYFVDFMETHSFDVCFSRVRGVRPDGKYVYELSSCDSDYQKLMKYSVNEIRNYLFVRNFLPAPASFMRRELFEKYGLFRKETRLIEDYPYWLYLTSQGVPFGFLDKVLIDYRLSGVSSTGVYGEKFMDDMYAIYDNYIFPYDKRFGIFQGIYNFLKRQGLNSYMAKAKWHGYSRAQKILAYMKYGVFFVYIYMQNKSIERKNKNGDRYGSNDVDL